MENFFTTFFSQLKKIPKKYIFPLIFSFIGMILFGYGLIQYFGNNQPQEEITKVNPTQIITPVKTYKELSLDVEGAVVKSGVYKIPENSRIQDALIAAGGLSLQADRDYVEKHINLAQKITDGQKIYIPRVGEHILGDTGGSTIGIVSTTTDGININSASLKELDSLPGVGQVTANKIIDGRPYQSPEDLLSRKIISQKVYGEIKDKITAN